MKQEESGISYVWSFDVTRHRVLYLAIGRRGLGDSFIDWSYEEDVWAGRKVFARGFSIGGLAILYEFRERPMW